MAMKKIFVVGSINTDLVINTPYMPKAGLLRVVAFLLLEVVKVQIKRLQRNAAE